ncbi:PepSY domain-containing protein [Novosphingobium sp. FGD1]|uniref:PepSY domain-containing protein n=1 Tax=Novosphingobium silvae TaxID=2692619 RepID=A0A7X4GJ32_9SPHN|nr:PepSY-associated TM helix domain-containing protein [Novosphingobium silvae]MYL98519.1 PepSY domain-containing protein [Novosphingobium silvae]
MKSTFRQSMACLHTWTGLLPGWFLFVIFLFGTIAYYQQEISHWMRPEIESGPVSARALDGADAILRQRAQGAGSWTIAIPDGRGGDGFTVSWAKPGAAWGDRTQVMLDPQTGAETAPRDTRGGFFLYRMHFDLHYMPVMWARYLVSLAALAMLVAIVSGIITHKKIFADFFLLRFGKGQRSWLDAHNVTAVMALPFYLMITYTGLVSLLFTLFPWAISASFPSEQAYYKAAFPSAPAAEVSSGPAPVMPLRDLVSRVNHAVPGYKAGYVTVNNPGSAGATLDAYPQYDEFGGARGSVHLDAVTGKVLAVPPAAGGATTTQRVMIDLHAGRFSGWGLRLLYFVSGLFGTVMVGTGLVLWTVKRRTRLPDPDRPYFGFWLAERLNIAVITGTPAGIAAYFLANRLLPHDLEQRADWEINSLFMVWGGVLVWAMARPARRGWVEGLSACAALFAAVPVINALTTPRGLVASLMRGDLLFAAFDLSMLATAALFAFAAWRVLTRRAKVPPRRTPREARGAFA